MYGMFTAHQLVGLLITLVLCSLVATFTSPPKSEGQEVLHIVSSAFTISIMFILVINMLGGRW